jgi:hypothetical protein
VTDVLPGNYEEEQQKMTFTMMTQPVPTVVVASEAEAMAPYGYFERGGWAFGGIWLAYCSNRRVQYVWPPLGVHPQTLLGPGWIDWPLGSRPGWCRFLDPSGRLDVAEYQRVGAAILPDWLSFCGATI